MVILFNMLVSYSANSFINRNIATVLTTTFFSTNKLFVQC